MRWVPGFRRAARDASWALLVMLAACQAVRAPLAVPAAIDARAYFTHVPEFDGAVYVLEAGLTEAPPLVLIHGLGDQGARDFEPILSALAQHYRVLAFDLPGFARSERAQKHYSPEDYARFVHVMVERYFHRPVSVVGHSMGGAIAALYASRYPDDVTRIALLDVAGILHFRDYTRTVVNARLSRQGDVLDPLRRFAHALFRVGTRPFVGVELSALPITQTSKLKFIQYDFGPALRGVRAPVWLGWGADDSTAPLRTLQALDYLLRPERVAIYEQSGHFPMRTEPRRVAEDLHAFFSTPGPAVPRARLVAGENFGAARCDGERNRVFEGRYESIALHGCKNAILRNVRARSVQLHGSSAELTDVELTDGDVGLSVVRSRLTFTGGHIVSDVCIELSGSRLNMAGVECVYNRAAIRVHGSSDFTASVSGMQRAGRRTTLHGKID